MDALLQVRNLETWYGPIAAMQGVNIEVRAGRIVTVLWDADGSRYGRGAGLSVLLDGALAAHADTTQGDALVVKL